jgi:hypothetical protein
VKRSIPSLQRAATHARSYAGRFAAAAFALVVLATHAMASEVPPGLDTQSLVQVRTIKALPNDVSALLGGQRDGANGIADAREQYNRTDVGDPRLPMRRFIVAGVSSNSVLVAYEQGGRGYSIQAKGYVLEPSGWRQVGE